MNIVFFGTPHFAAKVLKYLLDIGHNIQAVVTRQDKPKGRSGKLIPPPVKLIARQCQLPVFQPHKASDPEFAEQLMKFEADLFVVVAYGEIMKEHVLKIPKAACINLHTSLLPKYRGAAPIQRAIMNGEKETGVSIMYMAKQMDAGDVIFAESIPIGPNETFGELEERLCDKGSTMMHRVIESFQSGAVSAAPQDDSSATFAPKVELEDCEIHWELPVEEIHNLIRGVDPYPGAWCRVMVKELRKRMKIKTSQIVYGVSGRSGEILNVDDNGLLIACGHDALLIQSLQLEGKREMKPMELFRGTQLEFCMD